jgi:hypothetical protein
MSRWRRLGTDIDRRGMAAGEADIRKAIIGEVGANVLAIYRHRLEDDDTANGAIGLSAHRIEMALRPTALRAERAELRSLRETHRINDETARMLLRELDLEAVLETARAPCVMSLCPCSDKKPVLLRLPR